MVVIDGEFHEKHVQLALGDFRKDILLKPESPCVRTCRTDSRVDETELAGRIKRLEFFLDEFCITVHFRDGAAKEGDMGGGLGTERLTGGGEAAAVQADEIIFTDAVRLEEVGDDGRIL